MQRVLDPAQIEAFAHRAIARVRLPDPTNIFSRRAARLRKLSEGHAVGDYLRLMATLADAQQEMLNTLVPQRPIDTERLRMAREHGMPPLQADGWARDPEWRNVLVGLCDAMAADAICCDRIRALPADALEEQAQLLLGEASDGVDAQAAPFIMAALQVYWTRMVCSFTADAVAEHI